MGIALKAKTFVEISGNFTVIEDLSEETLDPTYDEAVAKVRGARVAESEPTVRNLSVNLKVRKDSSNAVWRYLFQQFLSRGATTLLLLGDGAKTHANGQLDTANSSNNTIGIRFNAKLHSFTEQRNAEDIEFNDITAKPCTSSNMTIAEIDAGAITYTAPDLFAA